MMAKEHETGRDSILGLVNFASAELERILNKIDSSKSSKDLQRDKIFLSNFLTEAKNNFEQIWETRKLVLTQEAKFRIFLSEIEHFSNKIDEISYNLNTPLDENLASLNSASKYVFHLESSVIQVHNWELFI